MLRDFRWKVWIEVIALRIKADDDDPTNDNDLEDDSMISIGWESSIWRGKLDIVTFCDLTGENSQFLRNQRFFPKVNRISWD